MKRKFVSMLLAFVGCNRLYNKQKFGKLQLAIFVIFASTCVLTRTDFLYNFDCDCLITVVFLCNIYLNLIIQFIISFEICQIIFADFRQVLSEIREKNGIYI